MVFLKIVAYQYSSTIGLHGRLHLPVLLLNCSTLQSIVQSWFAKRRRLNVVEIFNVVSLLILFITTVTKNGERGLIRVYRAVKWIDWEAERWKFKNESVIKCLTQCRSSQGSCLLKEVQVGCLTRKFWGLGLVVLVFFFFPLFKCMLSGKLYEKRKKKKKA